MATPVRDRPHHNPIMTPDLKRCSKNVVNCENKSGEETGVRGGSPAEKKWRFRAVSSKISEKPTTLRTPIEPSR